VAKSAAQFEKHLLKCSVSIVAKTSPNVSWEGLPFFKSSCSVNQAFLVCPNRSIATQLSAPQIVAQRVMKKISESSCFFRLFTLGSVIVEKWCIIDTIGFPII